MQASPFSRLAGAHALTVAGDTFVTVALAGSLFFDISPSAARGRVALSLLLTMAPFSVVAPLVGPAIDRTRGGRRLMVVLAAAGRGVLCLFLAGNLDGLILFPLAFGHLVLSKAHAVAKASLVPAAVSGEGELVEANSKLALGSAVVGFIAAAPAVAILRLAGGDWVVRTGALVFVAAAVAGLRIPRLDPGAPVDSAEAGHPETALRKARSIVLAAGATAALRSLVGFVTFLVAFVLRREGAPSWWFGVAVAASLVGTFLGNLVAPRLRDRLHEERIITAALAVIGVGGLAATQLGGRAAAVLVGATVGLGAAAGKLAFDSLVQRDAPESARGRTFARAEAWFQLVWVVGALVPVIVPFGFTAGFVVVAVVGLGAAVAYPVVRGRPARTPARDA